MASLQENPSVISASHSSEEALHRSKQWNQQFESLARFEARAEALKAVALPVYELDKSN